MSRLLVLSNGAGEDAIASKILDKLEPELKSRVVCCPLVGAGSALSTQFELCGPRVHPPSEGLFRESVLLALQDLAQGVIAGHIRQLKFLREVREKVAMVLAVGDLFPVLWAGLGGSPNVLFVGTAKSVYHHPYSYFERAILRRLAKLSLVRDEATAKVLLSKDVNAQCLGNAMMDEVQAQGLELPFESTAPVLTLFPGSRQKAPTVLANQLRVLKILQKRIPQFQAGVAIAPGTQVEALVQPALEAGWTLAPGDFDYHPASLQHPEGPSIQLLSGVLGDLLSASSVAFGQAGTANEQAAGAGVPVVAYDPRGEKGLRWYRKRQKGLLGEAVSVVLEDDETICNELELLLTDDEERQRRAQIGQERMGPAGGCQRMADAITEMWNGL